MASYCYIYFGACDFDQRVVDYFIKLINIKLSKDISIYQKAIQKLQIVVVVAKNNFLLQQKLKQKFQIQLMVEIPVKSITLKKSDLNKTSIENIILIGGSTNLQIISKFISEFLKEPKISIIPNEAIIKGLASQIVSKYTGQQFESIISIDATLSRYRTDGKIEAGGIIKASAVQKQTKLMNSTTFDSKPRKLGVEDSENINYEATLHKYKDQINKERINSKNSFKSFSFLKNKDISTASANCKFRLDDS
ncbi:hypothetical protein ABPG74_012859 [Tetrahymena malaccensis]